MIRIALLLIRIITLILITTALVGCNNKDRGSDDVIIDETSSDSSTVESESKTDSADRTLPSKPNPSLTPEPATTQQPLPTCKDFNIEDMISSQPTTKTTPEPSPEYLKPTSEDGIQIIVYKGDRKLELYDGAKLIGDYDIGLGFTSVGHKQQVEDGKTPEGTYYVCTKNPQSKYYLSLGISYPMIPDAIRGLENGLISNEEYDVIVDAINGERRPPWDTRLGGEIMIHGHGSDSDWTQGCVAVDDEIMDILWDKCPIGTQVTIYP